MSSDCMFKGAKTKIFWLGLILFAYSLFLFCQGVWLKIYYLYIYPGIYFVPSDYMPNSDWVFQMIGAIGPSMVGGFVSMIMGLYLMSKKEKSSVFRVGLVVLGYSIILLLQSIWILFIFPKFYSELYRYVATNVFINFPRFFLLLGTVVPPILGSIIFLVVSLNLILMRKKKQLPPTSSS